MKINSCKFALAAAGAMSVAFVLCSVFCVLWPQLALDLTAPMLHLTTLDHITPYFAITIRSFFVGLIQVALYTYAIVWLWAWMYNRLLERA